MSCPSLLPLLKRVGTLRASDVAAKDSSFLMCLEALDEVTTSLIFIFMLLNYFFPPCYGLDFSIPGQMSQKNRDKPTSDLF